MTRAEKRNLKAREALFKIFMGIIEKEINGKNAMDAAINARAIYCQIILGGPSSEEKTKNYY